MSAILDQVTGSLAALGVWTYWILGLTVLLETVVVTSIFFPGTFLVITGGMLAQHGTISYGELAVFVAVGAFLGAEISFRLGKLAGNKLSRRQDLVETLHARRARTLFNRYGGFALIIARFLGPLAGFVPFAAALARQRHHHFVSWNVASSAAFGLILPAVGYFFGDAFSALAPIANQF